MSTVTEDQVASDRDLHAARLSRAGWTYSRITDYLGYPNRRAAHRGVLRGLAEPAAEEAQLRVLRRGDIDLRLLRAQCVLSRLLEGPPRTSDLVMETRRTFRIIDSLLRVVVARCRLLGLFTHPYRFDLWYRRDVPTGIWLHLQREANHLGREECPPLRHRTTAAAPNLTPVVVALRPLPELDPDTAALIPASIQALLSKAA
jgi:hypothetical protein